VCRDNDQAKVLILGYAGYLARSVSVANHRSRLYSSGHPFLNNLVQSLLRGRIQNVFVFRKIGICGKLAITSWLRSSLRSV
jgi:hypothetical protein